ncbi:hypothetical protein H9Q13_13260 [Pontibacter sp. JH31]|uniref:Uncharacterized protein n=1 Tax=Pontibacter aquaedesilientis TaxID=2766980 RepID=A0ABR7XIJ9_9BACT|nr:hypothetical protein [Pontibacter aquaedesilientis]MBD1398137.1 hypothetical protein [Pontibacter aquaedesilientis]
MTKTIILSVLALASLILSFFYEARTPESQPDETAMAITPYTIYNGEDMARALQLRTVYEGFIS